MDNDIIKFDIKKTDKILTKIYLNVLDTVKIDKTIDRI